MEKDKLLDYVDDDENKHHLFSYEEIRYHLLQIYGKPKTEVDSKFIDHKATQIWNKMPKFRIKKTLHRELHENKCESCGVNTSSFQQRVQQAQKEELSSKIEDKINNIKPSTRKYVCKNGVLHNDEIIVDAEEFKQQILEELGFKGRGYANDNR